MTKLWIEVCLISAQGLRSSSLFNLHWFAVAWIDPADKYCTRIDTSGAPDPVWKTRFSTGVHVSDSGLGDLALEIEVYSREPIFLRESLQGKATIILKELFGKTGFSSPVEESGSFQLQRNGSGRSQGLVNVSVRVSAEREEPGLGDGKGFDPTERKEVKSPDRASRPVILPRQRGGNQTPRQAVETLSQQSGRKSILTPQEAVETLSEHPGKIQTQNFHVVSRQVVNTLSQEPGNSLTTSRQTMQTWFEEPGSNQALEIRPDSFDEPAGRNQALKIPPGSRAGSEAKYHQPPQSPTAAPPSSIGNIPRLYPRTRNLSPVCAVALAAGAIIFGDDFLSGLDFQDTIMGQYSWALQEPNDYM